MMASMFCSVTLAWAMVSTSLPSSLMSVIRTLSFVVSSRISSMALPATSVISVIEAAVRPWKMKSFGTGSPSPGRISITTSPTMPLVPRVKLASSRSWIVLVELDAHAHEAVHDLEILDLAGADAPHLDAVAHLQPLDGGEIHLVSAARRCPRSTSLSHIMPTDEDDQREDGDQPDLDFVLLAIHSLLPSQKAPRGPLALPSMNCFTMGWSVVLTSSTVPV